ncbi:hypothetical protein BRC2024_OFSGVTRC_CDS_0073 [Acinetobacter phage vB_AbaM_Rocket]
MFAYGKHVYRFKEVFRRRQRRKTRKDIKIIAFANAQLLL